MFVNVSSVDVFGFRIIREYRFGVKKLNRDVARAARMLNDIFCGRETKGICVSCLLNSSGVNRHHIVTNNRFSYQRSVILIRNCIK